MTQYKLTLPEDHHRTQLDVVGLGIFSRGESHVRTLSPEQVVDLERSGILQCTVLPDDEQEPALPPSLRPTVPPPTNLIGKMTVKELRAALEARGLVSDGKKAELAEQLTEATEE